MEDAVRVAVLPDVTPSAVTEMITWERKTAVKHLPDMDHAVKRRPHLAVGGGRSPIRDLCSTSRQAGAELCSALKRARRGDIPHTCAVKNSVETS